MPCGLTPVSGSERHVYPARQSAPCVQSSRQPGVSASITASTHVLPAGQLLAWPMVHARVHNPPGAKSRLRQTPGPHSVATVQGSPITGPHANRESKVTKATDLMT